MRVLAGPALPLIREAPPKPDGTRTLAAGLGTPASRRYAPESGTTAKTLTIDRYSLVCTPPSSLAGGTSFGTRYERRTRALAWRFKPWHRPATEIIAKVRRGRAAFDRVINSVTDH
jgi:hypothetical protein